MRETVLLDLLGEERLDFDGDVVIHVKQGYSRIRFASTVGGRAVLANRPLAYAEIRWVGLINRKQWWLLFPGGMFSLLGIFWAVSNWRDWGPFAVSVGTFLVLGVWPIALLARGKDYLGIASDRHVIVISVDRRRKQIQRILGLLRQFCLSPGVRWELSGTIFRDQASWDDRVPTGKESNRFRYAYAMGWLSLWGLANLCRLDESLRPYGVGLHWILLTVGVLWVFRSLVKRLRSK